MKTKDEYIDNLAAELKDWGTQIDLLTAKTENVAAHIRVKYIQELNDLHAKQQKAIDKMEELQENGGEAWETVKVATDKIWDDLRLGLASASSKFK
ncbi:MAG: sll1863 family stress response protein [Methylobacter sp.]